MPPARRWAPARTATRSACELPPGALLLYTDGLVERRDRDLDTGIDALAALSATSPAPLADVPDALVALLLPDGPDDDITLLLAQVNGPGPSAGARPRRAPSPRGGRCRRARLRDGPPHGLARSPGRGATTRAPRQRFVTNAVIHGRPPIELRMRSHRGKSCSRSATPRVPPGGCGPTPDDEHGRGLQLVSILADRWGTRPVPGGKAVWCVIDLESTEG